MAIGLIIGLISGAIGGMSLGGGAMMGAGVATGLSAGVCATVQAAQELEIMSEAQVDAVLIQAAKDITRQVELENEEQIASSADACAGVMEKLQNATN